MNFWTKFGIGAGVLALVAALLLIIKWQHDTMRKQEAIEQSVVEMKKLNEDIIRSQSKYISKEDLDKYAKEWDINLEIIRQDLKTLGAEVQGISHFLTTTPGWNGTDLPSTGETPGGNGPPTVECPDGEEVECPDPYGYQSNRQILALNEPFGNNKYVPFGSVGFSAWKQNPWDVNIFPRTYSVTSVLGQDKNGKHYMHHKFMITSQGKTHPIEIQDAKFVEVYPEPELRFNPRLFLGVDGGMHVNPLPQAEFTPTLQVFFASYGKTNIAPEWTFAGVGVGFETQAKNVNLTVTPFLYNLGQHLPLVDNLHVGPSVSVNTSGSFSVLGGIRVGL